MSECCAENNAVTLKSVPCPTCGSKCAAVSYQTVLLHIAKPWLAGIKDQHYYFCRSLNCDVVYVGVDNTVINTAGMKTKLGVKDLSGDAPVCYCFGVTRSEAVLSPEIKVFVTEQTKKGLCICSTHNPSGKCCLKDFPT